MFRNIGKKVKGHAIFVCVAGGVGSLVSAIWLWSTVGFFPGFFVLVGGCVCTWLSSWVTYAIGDTNVKITQLLEQTLELNPTKPEPAVNPQTPASDSSDAV